MVETVRTMRHGLAIRITHWAIVIEGVFLTITGFQLNGIFYFGLPEMNYSFHIIAGLIFIMTAFIFLYLVIAGRDYKWFAIRRIPYSVRYIFTEGAYWFRLRPAVQEPIKFDARTGEYKEKLIPSVIVVWWLYALMGLILAITGLADAFPATFAFVYSVTDPIGVALFGVGGLPFILAVHRLVVVFLIATVALHTYASIIYHMIPSIVVGYREEPVAE
jgi:F420-nonreducing hydrogenase I cytochrome b subunit